MNKETIEDAVRTILEEIGEDTSREGIEYTPTRVARLYKNLFYGYEKELRVMHEDERNTNVPEGVIPVTVFENESDEMLIRKVHFVSTCEHHLVSITNGEAWVGIVPDKLLLGMNKIDKIVKYFAARLQLQERLTKQVADWINDNVKPKGVIVIMKANHMCAELQGDDGHFVTSAIRGVFKENPEARAEFLELINGK